MHNARHPKICYHTLVAPNSFFDSLPVVQLHFSTTSSSCATSFFDSSPTCVEFLASQKTNPHYYLTNVCVCASLSVCVSHFISLELQDLRKFWGHDGVLDFWNRPKNIWKKSEKTSEKKYEKNQEKHQKKHLKKHLKKQLKKHLKKNPHPKKENWKNQTLRAAEQTGPASIL